MDETARAIAVRAQAVGEELIAFLQELIAIPTPNPPGENYERIAALLSERFRQVAVEIRETHIPASALTPRGIDADRYPRPALVGKYGDGNRKTLHLHGHFDVVPANRAEQYHPVRRRGRIYGRGAADMKSGLCAMWAAFLILQECGLTPERPVSLSLTPDEESGGETGAGHLLREGIIRPDGMAFMIMPECTSGDIWNASKGALIVDVVVRGKCAHSTLPHLGHSAFEDMLPVAEALVALRKQVETRQSRLPVEDPRAAFSTMALGGEGGGGEKFNILPGRYHFTVDRRPIPEEAVSEVRNELFAVRDEMRAQGLDVEFEEWLEAAPSLTEPDDPGCRTLAQALREVSRREPRFLLCPGFLDIRHFNSRGVPAVACGPGQLKVAHGPGEWVAESDLLGFVQALCLTMLRM